MLVNAATERPVRMTLVPTVDSVVAVDGENSLDRAVDLLLIDDDSTQTLEHVRRALPHSGIRLQVARDGAEGVAYLRAHPPPIVLLELGSCHERGLELLRLIRGVAPRAPVIVLAGSGAAHPTIEAMKLGALDYLPRPIAAGKLQRALDDARELVRQTATPGESPASQVSGAGEVICGSSEAMLDVYKAVGRVAAQDVTVLITGESGTGKELVARAIHQHSARSGGPFLALNCAAIPGPLLESELFGHEKGAFTGADRRRIGRFEQCRGGTLLLDEIGDMPLDLQVKLLRILQERTFERVGGTPTLEADVRIIASTHRDLRLRVAEQCFREDLFYRLSVFTIEVPPLRARAGDLAVLIDHYLQRFNRELGREVVTLSTAARAILEAHSWPGNVRELQSALKTALLNAHGHVLLPSFLPVLKASDEIDMGKTPQFDLEEFVRKRLSPEQNDLYAEIRARVDRAVFSQVLEFTQGNQRNAASVLGISRQTLRHRLRALNMRVALCVDDDEDRA